MSFIKAYIKSMRPYTFFITGFAGLLGILVVNSSVNIIQKIFVLILLFLSYGINQVINDFLGLKEDKINAPKRPFVSGELNKIKAIYLTTFIFIFGAILSYYFNPYALIIYLFGYFANFIYEYLKGIPILGNLWFGSMISLATIYGALAITNLTIFEIFSNNNIVYFSFLILLSSSTLCHFTYFKDYLGDKATNKKTLIVLLSPEKSKLISYIFSAIPFILLLIIFLFNLWELKLNYIFIFLFILTFIISQLNFYFCCFRYKKRLALELNFLTWVLFEVVLIALIIPLIAIISYFISALLIHLIFSVMYKKEIY